MTISELERQSRLLEWRNNIKDQQNSGLVHENSVREPGCATTVLPAPTKGLRLLRSLHPVLFARPQHS